MRTALPIGALACLWLLAWAPVPAAAKEVSFGEDALLADAVDRRLDQFSLLEAAIVAGGIQSQADLATSQRRLSAIWLEVGQPLIGKLPRTDRAQAIFSATHRLILTGKYRAECTEVQCTLETGDYNCVTATVLYLELCRRHGLKGVAIAIPGHVYCRLQDPQDEDVQTTCREWFEVRDGHDTSISATAIARQIASQSAAPRELSDVELIGKVYYNRGVSHLEAHQYARAIEILRTSLELDPQDEPARNNLLAAHNNWALALCDAGQYEAAAEKLAQGRTIDDQYAPLRTNDLYVHQKWVLHLCDHGRYSSAIELLEAGHQRRPDASLFDDGRYAVYGMWSRTLLEAGRLRDAINVIDAARAKYGDCEELVEQEIQAFATGVANLRSKGNAAAAQSVLTAGLARHPMAPSLRQLDQ